MTKERKLIYLISTAQHLIKNETIGRFKHGGLAITPTHSTILFLLEKDGPLQMSEIGKTLYIENSTVTGLIDRLEAKGFVSRLPAEEDRRKWIIAITEKGRDEIDAARNVIRLLNSDIGKGYSQKELDTLESILCGLIERFSGQEESIP